MSTLTLTKSLRRLGLIGAICMTPFAATAEEFSVTLTVPCMDGYICLPHFEMGMVGLIIVGEDLPNLDEASRVRHPGAASAAFREPLARIDAP